MTGAEAALISSAGFLIPVRDVDAAEACKSDVRDGVSEIIGVVTERVAVGAGDAGGGNGDELAEKNES